MKTRLSTYKYMLARAHLLLYHSYRWGAAGKQLHCSWRGPACSWAWQWPLAALVDASRWGRDLSSECCPMKPCSLFHPGPAVPLPPNSTCPLDRSYRHPRCLRSSWGGGRRTGVNVNIVFKDTLTFTIRDIADETIIIPLLNECWRKIIMCTSDTQQSQSWLCKHCTQNRQNSSLKYCMSQYKNVPSPAWGTMRKCMEVAGHSAVVHWVSQSIVGLIITHAALIILQTVRLCDKPRDGRQLQCTSHTHNLQRQAPK